MGLSQYFSEKFCSDRKDWEENLLKELKITELGNKTTKKLINGMVWPTLSLGTENQAQLVSSEWKKASSTYVLMEEQVLEESLLQELSGGVRSFFFYGNFLNREKWQKIESILGAHPDAKDIEAFVLDGREDFSSKKIKVINKIISGKDFHFQGGDSIQELALMAKNFIEAEDEVESYVGVFVDSMFFHNIAKIRAARLLLEKIQEERKSNKKFHLVALTSFEGWSIFERYSNMLRNETAVASAYIGGADYIQSSGYNTLYELEVKNPKLDEHFERSHRMGRNTSHILALESMLGVVGDAAFGSYHIESLTFKLCEEAWGKMQSLLRGEDISSEVKKIQETKLQMIKTRKLVLSGTNDYPDVKEKLGVELNDVPFFRVARIFEELRLKMEKMVKKPEVYIALFGDYGALNGRLNFVKNYFELLGLSVHEPGKSEFNFDKDLSEVKEEIVVFCALDDDYGKLEKAIMTSKAKNKFVAGKVEIPGLKNLYAGQNVYDVLKTVVDEIGEKK